MAPEQAAGAAKTSGPSADVYSLGAILYELLTGRPPFRGATVLETLEQVRHAEPVAPSRLVAGLPRDVETIALKCLEKDPLKRYETAAALAEDLHRFGAGLEIHARPVTSAERTWRWCRRNPLVASLSASAVLLLLLVAAVATAGYARTAAALGRESAAHKEATAALYHSFLSEASACARPAPKGIAPSPSTASAAPRRFRPPIATSARSAAKPSPAWATSLGSSRSASRASSATTRKTAARRLYRPWRRFTICRRRLFRRLDRSL